MKYKLKSLNFVIVCNYPVTQINLVRTSAFYKSVRRWIVIHPSDLRTSKVQLFTDHQTQQVAIVCDDGVRLLVKISNKT
jgi:hypothetical protein